MSLVFLEMCKYKYNRFNKKGGDGEDGNQKKFKNEFNLEEAISKIIKI